MLPHSAELSERGQRLLVSLGYHANKISFAHDGDDARNVTRRSIIHRYEPCTSPRRVQRISACREKSEKSTGQRTFWISIMHRAPQNRGSGRSGCPTFEMAPAPVSAGSRRFRQPAWPPQQNRRSACGLPWRANQHRRPSPDHLPGFGRQRRVVLYSVPRGGVAPTSQPGYSRDISSSDASRNVFAPASWRSPSMSIMQGAGNTAKIGCSSAIQTMFFAQLQPGMCDTAASSCAVNAGRCMNVVKGIRCCSKVGVDRKLSSHGECSRDGTALSNL